MNGKMKPLNIAHGIPTMYKDGKEITTIDDYNRYCRTGKCTRKKTSKNSSKKSSGVNKDEIQKMVEEIAEEKVNEIHQDLQSAISYSGGNNLSSLDLSRVKYNIVK